MPLVACYLNRDSLTPRPEFNWRLKLCQKLKISNLMPILNYKDLGHRNQGKIKLEKAYNDPIRYGLVLRTTYLSHKVNS